MTEEINQKNVKFYPEPTVGPIIYNEKGEILLIKCLKWGDYWHIPGGHIEIGETSEQALKREIMEETGLEIDNIEFICWQDAIEPEGFFEKKHFIFLDYCARMAGGKITKSKEMEEYIWIYPEQAIKTLKIDPATIKTINFYLEHIKNKAGDDKYKRALADYQNLLKQTVKEKMEFVKFANEQLLYEILPVYDNLKTAIEHCNKKLSDNWFEGVKHVVKQFKNVLEKIGVEEVKIIDKKFDHNTMEAISNEETDDKNLDGKVAKQVKDGYMLYGKVIEPAKVVVYKMNKE
ncbi:MAG: nucleotide exchange factor GrpE [Patescibacteria group bacterium]